MTSFALILLLVLLCLMLPRRAWSMSFRVGAAHRVITPDPLLPVSGGVGVPNPTTEKRGELTVRALVFEKDDERVALAMIDNLGWPSVWGDKTRALLPDMAPEKILIGATHTHSAPDAYCFPDFEGKHYADLDYLEWVCKETAAAIDQARRSAENAWLRIAVGEAQGKIAYNYYAPELYDRRCAVLQALAANERGEEERVIATLVNYAIHPEVLGANKGIMSPDLCGPLRDRIEAQAGGLALFVNGAQGGMVTADNRSDTGDLEIWEECVRIGELLADESLRIIADAPLQKCPALRCDSREIRLPVESPIMQFVLQNSPLAQNMTDGDSVITRINILNLGSAQLLSIPGEALPNIGFYLKRNMSGEHPFLLGLMNDAFGYMLTKYDFNSFEIYDYISQTSLGEMAGEMYVEQALQLVRDTPAPDGL